MLAHHYCAQRVHDYLMGADTPPTPTPTHNGLVVATHTVYLVLLFEELFRYAGEPNTLRGLHKSNLLEKEQVVTEKQNIEFLTPPTTFANGAGPKFCTTVDELLL